MSGMARWSQSIVIGEHPVLVHLVAIAACPDGTRRPRLQVKTKGQAANLTDYPNVDFKKDEPRACFTPWATVHQGERDACMLNGLNGTLDPALSVPEFEFRIVDQGSDVRAIAPLIADLGIDFRLRLGDLIAIRHADHHWGRSYRENAVSICLCIHG